MTHHFVTMRYADRSSNDEILASILGLIFVFLGTFVVFVLALEMRELDFVTSISASVTALANVGPGLGDVIGPAGNFSLLPDMNKWLFSIEMILRRMEILSA